MKKNLVITGANGWLGKSLLKLISIHYKTSFNVYPLSNSVNRIIVDKNTIFETKNFYENLTFPGESILFHFAFLTKDKIPNLGKDEYFEQNFNITQVLKRIIEKNNVSELVYISSGAIYKKNDIYSDLKTKDEIFFKELCFNKNINLLIPRLFNIGGPYINKHQDYALSNFILQALNSRSIIIQSKHLTYRSYIHVFDFLNICLKWVLDVHKDNFFEFDTRGNEIIEIGELAYKISEFFDYCSIMRNPIKNKSFQDNYCGNIFNQNLLTSKYGITLKELSQIISDTIFYIKQEYKI